MTWYGLQIVFEAETLEDAVRMAEAIEAGVSKAGHVAAMIGPGEVNLDEVDGFDVPGRSDDNAGGDRGPGEFADADRDDRVAGDGRDVAVDASSDEVPRAAGRSKLTVVTRGR